MSFPKNTVRTLSILVVAPTLVACVSTSCEMDQAFLQAQSGAGIQVPSDLEGYRSGTRMELPEGGTGELRLTRASGSCLAEPPSVVMAEAAVEAGSVAQGTSAGPAAPAYVVPDESTLDADQRALLTQARSGIEPMLAAWAEAWSAQDARGFLAFYADDYDPPGSMRRSDWVDWQVAQIKAPSEVAVGIIEVELELLQSGNVLALVTLDYSSDVVDDSRQQLLELTPSADGWLIVSGEELR